MIGIIPTGFIGIGKIELSCTFPCLEYMIGISLIDLSMKIDSTINKSTNDIMKMNTPTALLAPARLEYTWLDIPATIDANINTDTPLVMPFSVMRSPNQRIIIAPTLRQNVVSNTIPIFAVSMTLPPNR